MSAEPKVNRTASTSSPASSSDDVGAAISLRRFEERTRRLPLDQQIVECVDLLQSPELVVDDLLRSLAEVHASTEPPGGTQIISAESPSEEEGRPFFYPSRELFVQGDGCSFTCLATDINFVSEKSEVPAEATARPRRQGAIDYAAVTCESRPFPVFGFTQRSDSESAYPLLLRALASTLEMLGPRRFDLMDRDVYRGLLGPAPVFDLALVLWDDKDNEEEAARLPLCELSRDLAEVL